MTSFCETNAYFIISSINRALVKDYRTGCINTIYFPTKTHREENKNAGNCSSVISEMKLSSDSTYLAAVSKDKYLVVWKTHTWDIIFTHALVKRTVAIDFVPNTSQIVVADKAGDVYLFDYLNDTSKTKAITNDEESDLEPLLGHFSMLLDMKVTNDGKYLITCDRDEKIRVSCFPNAYNIHSFCLGHDEFVNNFSLLPHNQSRLVSSSGDGSLKLWDYMTGTCLHTYNISEHIKLNENNETDELLIVNKLATCKLSKSSSLLVVSLNRSKHLILLEISNNSIDSLLNYELPNIPLNFIFSAMDELIILDEEDNFNAFKYTCSTNTLICLKDHQCISFINDNKDKISIDSEIKSSLQDIKTLYKQKYDNMADYLKKKQERLDLQQKLEPTQKKLKV